MPDHYDFDIGLPRSAWVPALAILIPMLSVFALWPMILCLAVSWSLDGFLAGLAIETLWILFLWPNYKRAREGRHHHG